MSASEELQSKIDELMRPLENAERSILVVFDEGDFEIFPAKDIDYWLGRRLDKSGLEPEEAYYIEDFDFKPLMLLIEQKKFQDRLETLQEEEKREYERLKKKFEDIEASKQE